MPDVNDIIDMSTHLLATINRVYAAAGIAVPERQYYVIGGQGQTVHDCEQVTVSWDQAYSGLPGNEASIPARCDDIHTGSFIIEVVRRVNTARTPVDPMAPATAPTGTANIPGRWGGGVQGSPEIVTPENYKYEAQIQMKDAILLLKAGLLAGEATLGNNAIVDVSAGSPQGGYQATIMNYTATLSMDPYYTLPV